tara:strand:- start:978 stop:2132 length:1155 start_codon:yes stop_codon:yes gene_type:complete
MNVLEKYASNCGVKIREPFVATSYFPLTGRDYIVIDNRSIYGPNSYDLFDDVLSYISPVLKEKNIDIYSFANGEKDSIEGTRPFIALFKKQEAFLIKNSKLVVGCDNITNYQAAGLNVPSIGLYACYPSACTAPIWGNSHSSLDSERCGNLPAYGVKEDPKTINFIEPEKIANLIFEKLNLDERVGHETFYMGDHYPTRVVEAIPDFAPPAGFMEGRALNLRMDYNHDENMTMRWLQNRKINLLVDKPVNINLLKYFKSSIVQLTININESFNEKYFLDAQAVGVPVQIFCEDQDKIESYRFKYFDFEVNESIFKKRSDLDEQEALINDKTTFLTGKILLSKGKKYSCLQAKNEKRELTGKPEPVYDVPEFWKELDHYRLINEL